MENPESGLCDGPRVGGRQGTHVLRALRPTEGADQTAATTSQEPPREGKASLGFGGGAGLREDSTAGEAAPPQALPAGYAKGYKLGCRVDLALLSRAEDTNFQCRGHGFDSWLGS